MKVPIKFKVGDKVRPIDNDITHGLMRDNIYTVIKIIDAYAGYARNNNYDCIVVINDAGWARYYLGWKFEKIINFSNKRLLK